ncbi:hypothetical protein [Janthinobacterium sp. PSPC3-1]|uniref:hypothetical protein n=1 Tax=Janthinobacterium sp. PSPC3-1 TaxID=2804653 RepID=UPI003CE81630
MKMHDSAPGAFDQLNPHIPILLPYARIGSVTLATCARRLNTGAARCISAATPWPDLLPPQPRA